MKKYKLSDVLLWDSINQSVKHYGIEGAKEVIERVYTNSKFKNMLLKEWERRYGKGK